MRKLDILVVIVSGVIVIFVFVLVIVFLYKKVFVILWIKWNFIKEEFSEYRVFC